jgi:16S rRNA (guanine966-N2)-methyltransferase
MRVISGQARGVRLKRVPGDTTRPIMDRAKESLFNILGDIHETRWLDLFAGTGQVGIEALSRGADSVVFTDTARAAIRTIHDNLRLTKLANGAEVIGIDAFRYLDQFNGRPFNFIYVAPPQYKGIWVEVLRVVDKRPFAYLAANGLVIVQIDPKEYDDVALSKLQLVDSRTYGNTQLCFYKINNGQKSVSDRLLPTEYR